MVVVLVMDSEQMQVLTGKLALTPPAYPGVHLECLLPIGLLPLLPVVPGVGNDPVQPVGVFPSLVRRHVSNLQLKSGQRPRPTEVRRVAYLPSFWPPLCCEPMARHETAWEGASVCCRKATLKSPVGTRPLATWLRVSAITL